MAGLNKLLVIGNVGTDPDMRYTPNGNSVTSFRLATGRTYTTGEGERRQETELFTVTAWRQLAEQCNQYLTKGKKVYVEGRLKSNSWTANDWPGAIQQRDNRRPSAILGQGPSGGARRGGRPRVRDSNRGPRGSAVVISYVYQIAGGSR